MAKYVVTYTDSPLDTLDEDFTLIEIQAHNHRDAMTILRNIEHYFGGVTITCEEDVPKQRPKRRRVNSDKRKERISAQNLCNR